MILADPRNPRARDLRQRLADLVGEAPLPAELVVAIGGDGWMLSTIHDLGPGRVYLGVNAGRLGFLLNDLGADTDRGLEALARAVQDHSYEVHAFPTIEIEAAPLGGGEPIRAASINDVFVERTSGQTALLRVGVQGAIVVEQLACDGLVVATALGSTAYSFSAGGVPSHPKVEALHVTPICAHTPRLAPFLLPAGSQVEIEVLRADLRPVRAFADGQELGAIERATVRPTTQRVRLAFLAGHDFTGKLIDKILRS